MEEDIKLIYNLLRYLRNSMDYSELDVDKLTAKHYGVTQNMFNRCVAMMVDEGFIKGVKVVRSMDREISIINLHCAEITLKGIEYLEENSLMRRAGEVAKGIIDVIK